MEMLKISDNRRFLTYDDGKPFFYLGDTAWELFHRLDREDADRYLRDRARKGFTVIQAVVLAEFAGLTEPNAYGFLPLADNDPTRPVEGYFEHVDYVVNRAEELGLFIGMLPTWGDKWNKQWGIGPEVFTPANVRVFGEFLGKRYAAKPIIWILGGDRHVETDRHAEIVRAMAAGIRAGDGGRNLMTFHPTGQCTSAQYFHSEDWLDFNTLQSGHTFNRDNYRSVAEDYARTPVKPCMDSEPGYEDHPSGFKAENGYMDAYDARKFAYWALFAGAHGHTYGCHDIWQMLEPGRTPITAARTPWKEALDLPGAKQMGHARALLESRPFLTRIPDQSLIVSDEGTGTDHVQATRDFDGSYAFVYISSGKPVAVDLTKLSGASIAAAWYDPRTGVSAPIGAFARTSRRDFVPPAGGPDWVLVLDAK